MSDYWGICDIGSTCQLRTLCDHSQYAKLKPVSNVHKRVGHIRKKTIQHLRWLLLLRVASIGCKARLEVVFWRENEMLDGLRWGVALQVIYKVREIGVVEPSGGESNEVSGW